MWFPVTIWKLVFLDLEHLHDSFWLQVLSWHVWTSPSNHLWQLFKTLDFRCVSDEQRWAFRNNVTWLETRHKTPLDWRAAEIMWGTDEKARSQMAQRKKWGHVTERSCSFRLPTVKYSNGVMSKISAPLPLFISNQTCTEKYGFSKQKPSVSHWCSTLKDKNNSGFGLKAGDQRDLNETHAARSRYFGIFWVFFPLNVLTKCQRFWNIRPTTHKNGYIQTSRPADVEIENKSKQLRVRKTTSVSAHSLEFCTFRFSFVTLTDTFMALFFLASTSDRCSWFLKKCMVLIKRHHLLKLWLF